MLIPYSTADFLCLTRHFANAMLCAANFSVRTRELSQFMPGVLPAAEDFRTESMPAQCHPGTAKDLKINPHSKAAATKAWLIRNQSSQPTTAIIHRVLGGT
jgi:hypothetical protein